MNKQADGKGKRGIEWTDYTWNVVKGCQHACRWTMPDGTVAVCYAETVANKFTQVYPHGFEHHYWTPKALDEPLKLQEPAKIFLDSMSDLMGKWVPEEQIRDVLDVCHRAHWHTFQLLTKNAPRLEQFEFPSNVWVGVSAPPTSMLGHQLNLDQQKRLVDRQIRALSAITAGVKWMSVEPLSFDIAPLLVGAPLDWVVIGAATNGFKTYQPEREWVVNLLDVLDAKNIPVFFKGNLKWDTWREEFPTPRPPKVENVSAPIVITADAPAPMPLPEHKGVLVSKRFLMLTWLHESKSAEISVMRDTITAHERWTVGDTAKPHSHPLRFLTAKQAQTLIDSGEWSPVNTEIIGGKVVKHVQHHTN